MYFFQAFKLVIFALKDVPLNNRVRRYLINKKTGIE